MVTDSISDLPYSSLNLLISCEVSLISDGTAFMSGCSQWSINWEMCLVGLHNRANSLGRSIDYL